jgi:glycosyltransferase involved in cell wall biosynthesis
VNGGRSFAGSAPVIRVAHVVEAMHQGGAESLIVEHVLRAAPDVASTVIALNRDGPAFEAARAAGADVLLLGKGSARLAGLFRLAGELRRRRIDVVNGHNPTGALYGTLAGMLAGVPAIVRTEHSIHYTHRGGRFYGPVEALLTARADRVICVCEASRRSHASRLGWAADRFVTVLNGVSETPGAVRERAGVRAGLGLPPGAPVALTVGSLTRQKSYHVLLDAMRVLAPRLPDAVLLIAGEGPLRAALLAQHAALGLGDRVRFLGSRNDVPDLMEACDLMVLSSSREGLPVTLLEAMRARRAAVATDVGGNAEAVEDGVTGRIVPVGDAAALAEAMAGLLGRPDWLARCGEAGHARWRERFTAGGMVRATESVYREALVRRGRRGTGGRRDA